MEPTGRSSEIGIAIEMPPADSTQSIDNPSKSVSNPTSFKVITWNLWCIMFAPRTLSNPRRCGKYLQTIAEKEHWSSFDGLIVLGLQEAWAWKTGLFPAFILRMIAYFEYIPYLGTLISWLFQLVSMLCGLLPIFKCLPLWHNPKGQLSSILQQYLPYSYYDCSIPMRCILDNGLLLLCNRPADRNGSHGFVNHACDDSMAYKGFLWAYFQDIHCLVLNTHLQAAGDGDERLAQIEEINQFVEEFEGQHSNRVDSLKIIACGDWNIDMTNHDRLVELKMDGRCSVSQQISVDLTGVDLDLLETESVPSAEPMDPNHQSTETEDDGIEIKYDEADALQIKIHDTSTPDKGHKKQMSLSHIGQNLKTISPKIRESINKMPLPVIKTHIFKSRSYANIPKLMGADFVKCNDCNPTAVDVTWGCLDHILANFEFVEGSFKHETLGTEGGLSDHLLIKNEFVACH